MPLFTLEKLRPSNSSVLEAGSLSTPIMMLKVWQSPREPQVLTPYWKPETIWVLMSVMDDSSHSRVDELMNRLELTSETRRQSGKMQKLSSLTPSYLNDQGKVLFTFMMSLHNSINLIKKTPQRTDVSRISQLTLAPAKQTIKVIHHTGAE